MNRTHERQQRLRRLMDEEGLTYRELAAELGVSVSAAHDRVVYAAGPLRETADAIRAAGVKRRRRGAVPARRDYVLTRARQERLRQHWLEKAR